MSYLCVGNNSTKFHQNRTTLAIKWSFLFGYCLIASSFNFLVAVLPALTKATQSSCESISGLCVPCDKDITCFCETSEKNTTIICLKDNEGKKLFATFDGRSTFLFIIINYWAVNLPLIKTTFFASITAGHSICPRSEQKNNNNTCLNKDNNSQAVNNKRKFHL